MVKMTEKEFILKLKEIGIDLSSLQIEMFKKYAEFLLEYNSHTNLTAIRNIEDIYLKHFYDSIIGIKYMEVENKKILDIGSGAGFPGVPIKIVFPNCDLTLLDSNGKKTTFLEKLKSVLNIDYTVINDRAEKYILNRREYYDIVVSRAVSAMPVLSELSIPFVAVGGLFVPYKGQLDETLENGEYAIKTLGGDVLKVEREILPNENSIRSFVIVQKKCKTDNQFPRLFEKISKKPLQNNE